VTAGQPLAATAAAVSTYALRLGDDALVLAQRLGQWVAGAPQIEEDVALANIALDLLGQARALLTYAGQTDGTGRTEDDLAFGRDEREFLNLHLVERPNEDFAVSMARQLFFATYQLALYDRLRASRDATLAGVAGKAVKEVAYHRDHATQWVLRLGDGTEESHRRMQAGLDRMWPYVGELFAGDELDRELAAAGVAVDVSLLRTEWEAYVGAVLAEATLDRPDPAWTSPGGGRRGLHTEEFGQLVAELQHLHRSHPGASW
jgi:ring-1,2-phenylacetyl-CoA epoxidase subunit PaaC